MFDALHAALVTMIETEGGTKRNGAALYGVTVSCAGADAGQYPPPGVGPPAIMLFLYDIRENTALRSSVTGYGSAVDGTVPSEPVRVDCSYLVTAWPVATALGREHQMLGAVLRVLLRHPRLPAAYLGGELAEQDPPARILGGGQMHSVGEFWQAVGSGPKATLHYGVTVTVRPDVSPPDPPNATGHSLVPPDLSARPEPPPRDPPVPPPWPLPDPLKQPTATSTP